MRRLFFSPLLAATLTILALATAPATFGAGEGLGWSAPDYLSSSNAVGLGPSVGVLGDGTPVATWDESSLSGWFPVMSTQPIGGDWTDPSPLSSEQVRAPGVYSFGPRMAVSRGGAYVATWFMNRTETIAGNPTIVPVIEGATGTVTAGGSPSVTPQLFANAQSPHGFNYPYSPRVYMDADGNGVVSYLYSNCCGSTWSGMSGFHAGTPTGTPGLPQTSLGSADFGGSNDDDSINTPAVAVAPDNSAGTAPTNSTMAALTTRGNSGPSPRQADLYTTTDPSSWTGPATTLPLLGSGASVGVLADGRVIATSTTSDNKRVIWISGDGGATTIDEDVGSAGGLPPASIATAADGSATIAYSADDGGALRPREVTISASGQISAPVTFASTATVHDVQAAYAPDGTAYVIWSQEGSLESGTTGIYSSFRLAGGEFSATPTTVIAGLTDAHAPRIAISSDGIATIVAQVEPESTWRIAAFSHANPAPPVNLTLPKVSASGAIAAGTVLSCDRGTWTASPTNYRYEWLLDGVSTGPPADASTLTLGAGQIGKKIACRVTATNQNGSGVATSAEIDTGSAAKDGDSTKSAKPKIASIKAKGGKVSVTVSCPSTAASCSPVTVTLTVPAAGHVDARVAKPKSKKKRQTTVGRATVTAKPGTSKTVVVGLNKVGAKLLAKRHKLSVKVTVSAGKSVLKRGSVVLKPKRR
jgi:hypothetical protein